MAPALGVRTDTTTIWIEGDVDLSTGESFADAAADALRTTRALDLAGVTFMDSTGLNALLLVARTANGTPLVIRNPSPFVRRLLDLTLPQGAPGLEICNGSH